MRRKTLIFVALIGLVTVALLASSGKLRSQAYSIYARLRGRATIEEKLAELNPRVRDELAARFAAAAVTYPPSRIILAGFKQERMLQVFASDESRPMRLVAEYPILGASGSLGPKLREGDRQVPEGIYRVVSLNPNSQFHLSMELDYPNNFDREHAMLDGRTSLGGDIFIHGSNASVGCLAMGDAAIEELFVLAADAGLDRIEIVISPLDLRRHELPDHLRGGWRDELYALLRERLAELPQP